MDFSSLAAAHLTSPRPPRKPGERAETRYYREADALRGPMLRPLLPLATAAGLILLLLGAAVA
jgi:hypothetical protein